ncbi:MAG: cobalt-precorrin-5B (C(1))-methyltransferase CbiD [Candidatus Hydrothermarchaeales archaeon]
MTLIEPYVQKNGKTLRRGYTTGTCAAAAAKAATKMLYTEEDVDKVEVMLPTGDEIRLSIVDRKIGADKASCCVIKDAGDDPDVTNGAKICAIARKVTYGVTIKGGKGVGTVTKNGLEVAVGEAAINPVPMKMIRDEVSRTLPKGRGVEIEIKVLDGEKLAKRTLNKKLGIVGGISIIGTTGIVEPRSLDAFKRSLSPQIDIALAAGFDDLVLVPGRISERNAIAADVPEDAIIQMGNFVGFILKECARKGVKRALLYGRSGKLVKVSAGIFDTHSKTADARLETIAAHAASLGAGKETVKGILNANTTEEARGILKMEGLLRVFDIIAERASTRAMEYTNNKLDVATIITSRGGEIIGRDGNCRRSRWAESLL